MVPGEVLILAFHKAFVQCLLQCLQCLASWAVCKTSHAYHAKEDNKMDEPMTRLMIYFPASFLSSLAARSVQQLPALINMVIMRTQKPCAVLQGSLCSLDVGEDSCLHKTLLMDGLQFTRTVLESDFGNPICDVNYLESLSTAAPNKKVFLCLKDDSSLL